MFSKARRSQEGFVLYCQVFEPQTSRMFCNTSTEHFVRHPEEGFPRACSLIVFLKCGAPEKLLFFSVKTLIRRRRTYSVTHPKEKSPRACRLGVFQKCSAPVKLFPLIVRGSTLASNSAELSRGTVLQNAMSDFQVAQTF